MKDYEEVQEEVVEGKKILLNSRPAVFNFN